MKNSKLNKALSLILAVLMVFSSLPVTVFAAEDNYGVMEVYTASSSADYHKYYSTVYSVTFCDYIDEVAVAEGEAKNPQFAWDVSVDKDRSVMAWMKENADVSTTSSKKYDVYIGAEGGVKANPNSAYIFGFFSSLKEVKGLENFKTETATDFYRMFYNCTSLESIDLSSLDTSSLESAKEMFLSCKAIKDVNLSGWDTSKVTGMKGIFQDCFALQEVNLSNWDTRNVTDMSYVFRNCYELTELDLSSFNTSKVTTMQFMFYQCKKLLFIYAGDGWTTESIANLNDGVFNCCYAKFGGQTEYEKNPNPPVSCYYAVLEEDGGYLTKAYNVEYEYEGDVPFGITAPEKVLYPIGVGETVTVTVEGQDVPVGYTFSGWETDDATVGADNKFVLENDVLFVGTWKKIKAEDIVIGNIDPEAVLKLEPGDTTFIEVTVKPDDAYENGVVFESSDEGVVKVDENGNVTAVGEGEAVIKITSKDEAVYVKVNVLVEYTTYNVTYEFKGDVKPENVDCPEDETKYKSGETVSIIDVPYVTGYRFSGWETQQNIEVDENGDFVITEDTHFVGKWTKVYKVTYKYDKEYALPSATPLIPATVYYEAGSSVKVADIPFAEGYIFEGWDTEDAEITELNKFLMPEKDVVLYGYFRKPVSGIEVNNVDKESNTITVNSGETKTLEVAVTPDDATFSGLEFSSEDPDIAEVDENGNITAKKEGTTTITIKSKDKTEDPITIEINVVVKNPVTELNVKPEETTLYKSETDKITASVNEDATNKKINYYSEDPSVATVDENGNITAVNEGTTRIKVESDDDKTRVEYVTVTVKNPVTEIIVEKEEYEILVGEEITINANVNDDATEKGLVYEKGEENELIKVSVDGVVNGLEEGTATITITSKDNPDVTKTVTVTVKAKQYKVTYEFVGEVQPENVTAPGEKFYKDGTTVDVETEASANGYIFSGWSTDDATVADGKFVINNDVHFVGSWTKLYNVTYIYEGEVPTNAPAVPAEENYAAGKTVEVKGVPSSDGYTFTGWYTEDVTFADGKFTMPAQNVVLKGKWEKNKVPVTDITVDKTEIELEPGKTDKIIVTVTPDDATDKTVTYTSSNPEVAEVEEDGTIVAKKDGETIITVKTEDGSEKTVTVKVTVKTPIKYYEVTYEYTGDVPAIAPKYETKSYEEGSEVKVEDAPSVDGYIFKGWTSEDADITSGVFNIYKDVEIIGKWEKIPEYNVTYKFDGEAPEVALPETKTYKTGELVTVADTYDVTDGYIFKGWTSKDADITSGDFNIYKDVEIIGTWEKIPEYKVTYIYDGEVPTEAPDLPNEESYAAEKTVEVKGVPSLDGYTFTGWYSEDVTFADGKFTMPAQNVVLKGKWEKINYYNVEYKYEGDVPAIAPAVPGTVTYKEGSEVTVAEVPSVDGYTFSGWSTTDADIASGKFNIYNDVTIVGKWIKNKVPVTEITAEKEITIEEGKTDKIIVTVKPDNATDKSVTYESSNPDVVTVDENGNITAVKEGTAIITVKSKDDHSKVTTVTVKVEKPDTSVTSVTVPKNFTMILGEETVLDAYVNANAANKGLIYESLNPEIATVDENGNIKTVAEGKATIRVKSAENPAIYGDVVITVTTNTGYNTKHYIVFGKTEKIGFYKVSLDGGETFFTQFGNDHLEVEKGTVIIVKAVDVFGDPFTFYINGEAVTPDENGYVHILVDKFILIGALGIPVVAPDAEESLNFFQQLIQKIKAFFEKLFGWLK